ncbi:MAG: hypothetical protein P8M20_08625 [Planctomycetaceae bacterium]|nr:hypothetical protein [Planctomycetaceae bacterium]
MAGIETEVSTALTRRKLLVTASLTAVLVVSGCQSVQKLEVTQTGAPKFERFQAEYHFKRADQLLGRSFAEASDIGVEAQTVQPVAAESSWSEARLNIECPPPRGDASLALLTLTLSDRRGPAALLYSDARQLTIQRADVDLLIASLANDGYFDEDSEIVGGSQLAVQIDRGKVDREWVHDERLLDLACQALVDGMPAW